MSKEEILDLVDEEDEVISQATRKEVREKSLLHRIAKIIIVNDKGEFLVQKRSKNKDIFPGYWDFGVAETVCSGESYEEAASRGLKEEIGIFMSPIDLAHSLQFRFKYRSPNHNTNCKIYKAFYNKEITLQTEEIDCIEFLKKDEVIKLMSLEDFYPGSVQIFAKYARMKELE